MSQHNPQKPPSRLVVMGTVSFYLVAALTMVIANKWVLSSTSTPLFFLFAQLLVAVILFFACHLFGILTLPFTLDLATCKGMAPLVSINVLGLSFNNYTLKYVDASFYQIARGLVLPLTALLSYAFLASRPSLRVLFSCAVVTVGFFIGVGWDNYSSHNTSVTVASSSSNASLASLQAAAAASKSTSSNTLGIFFGLLSSFTTAASAIIIKRSLSVVGGSTLSLAWYSNLLSAVVILPIVWFLEGEDVKSLLFGSLVTEGVSEGVTAGDEWLTFIWGTAITGLFGFLICIAGFLSIKVTSPITHMVSSAVRGVVVTLLGVWLFHEVITVGRGLSILTILAGSIYYTWVKNEEANQSARESGGYERIVMEDVEGGKKRTAA